MHLVPHHYTRCSTIRLKRALQQCSGSGQKKNAPFIKGASSEQASLHILSFQHREVQAFPPEPSGPFAQRPSARLDRVWASQIGGICLRFAPVASKTRSCLSARDLIQLHYHKWQNDVKLLPGSDVKSTCLEAGLHQKLKSGSRVAPDLRCSLR